MFSFHKPRVYRSTEGCCICRAKSSSSRFTDSKKYEDDSVKCFNLEKPRQGEICNACVLLVKRFKRLPVGSNRHWGHVVDARIGPGMKSMTKFKKMKEESLQQQQQSADSSKPQTNKASSIPEKFCKIFRKNKNKNKLPKQEKKPVQTKEVNNFWDEHSSPTTPESFNSDGEEHNYNGRNRSVRIQRRKIRRPRKYSNRFENIKFIDETFWERRNTCCGLVYENMQYGALLIDVDNCVPCPEHIKLTCVKTDSTFVAVSMNSNNIYPILKKHHLYYTRNLDVFPLTQEVLKAPENLPLESELGNYSIANMEIIRKTENPTVNSYKTDSTSIEQIDNDNSSIIKRVANLKTHTDGIIPESKSNSFLHKIRADSCKVMKHSFDKFSGIKTKASVHLSEMKNLVKLTDYSKFKQDKAEKETFSNQEMTLEQDTLSKLEKSPKQHKTPKQDKTPRQDKLPKQDKTPKQDKSSKQEKMSKNEKPSKQDKPVMITQTSAANPKFNDNSSDSGFDENLPDTVAFMHPETNKKIVIRSIDSLFIKSAVALNAPQSFDGTPLGHSARHTYTPIDQTLLQPLNDGSQKLSAMYNNKPSEAIINITDGRQTATVLNVASTTNSNGNHKYVYVKAKTQNNAHQQSN